jgi:hypothetical protein
MEAKGALRIAADSHSGLEGLARAQLMGTYDTTTGEASLDYTLLLGGPSPAGGAADGSGAFPTPWDISRLHLRFGYPGGWERLRVGLADAGLALAALSPGEGPVTAPTQEVCVAEAQLKLRIEPSIGAVSRPGARVETTGPFYGASNSSILFDVKGRLDPEWGDPPVPVSEVALPLRLPAGFIYEVSPAVDVTLGGPVGSTTRANLPSLRLPESAPLRCGDEHGTCLRLGCGETYEALGVEVLAADGLAPAPSCLAGTAADFAIRVTDTEGLAPSRVSYALDPSGEYCGPSPTVLCDGDCPVDPVFPITVSGLSPGVHRVAACAGFESDPFCAHHSAAFAVEALTCPSDFRVLLDPGEVDVAASDPRIAGNLQASVSGCGAGVPVTDDRPGSFPPGVTTVQFAAGGAGACQTRVTVIPSALSLKHQRPPAVDSLLELFAPLTLPSSLAGRVPVGSSPVAYLLGEDGRATVVGPSGLANVRFSAAAPTWHTIGLPTGPWRLAPHPSRPFHAVLGRPGAVGPWTIKVVQGTQVLGTASIPGLPGYQQSLTAIGWSPDGHRLAVAGVAWATGVGPGPVYVAHVWDLTTPTSPVGPATTTHPAPSNAVVHEILLRASDLLVASGRGLYRLDPGWNPVYLRGNLDMVIGPGGDSVILASVEPTAKIRLVYRTFGPAGETREGPELLRTKMGTSEIAVTGDGRFAAITTYVGTTGNMAVPVFELESLSATSPPVAAVLTEYDGSDPQFRK